MAKLKRSAWFLIASRSGVSMLPFSLQPVMTISINSLRPSPIFLVEVRPTFHVAVVASRPLVPQAADQPGVLEKIEEVGLSAVNNETPSLSSSS